MHRNISHDRSAYERMYERISISYTRIERRISSSFFAARLLFEVGPQLKYNSLLLLKIHRIYLCLRNGNSPKKGPNPRDHLDTQNTSSTLWRPLFLLLSPLFPALLHSHSMIQHPALPPLHSSPFFLQSKCSPPQPSASTFRLFFAECWFVENQHEDVLFAELVIYIAKTDFACST